MIINNERIFIFITPKYDKLSHLEIHESIDDNDNRNMSSRFIENSIGFAFVYKHVSWSFDQNFPLPTFP